MSCNSDEDEKMKIESDPDFIALKRFGFSLDKLSKRYPDGAPTHIIAAALLLSEEEIEIMYQEIVSKLRTRMKVE